jgi:hypothetical protein
MNRLMTSMFWVLLSWVCLASALAQQDEWPRTLPLNKGMVTIYSPQVDEMNGNIINYRAALAYRASADAEPVFGAGWFESRIEIDSSNRIVHPVDFKVTETRFPAGTEDLQTQLSSALAWHSGTWNLDFTLDELEAALETAEAASMAEEGLNTAPPQIIYRDHPALLVSIDGQPILREIENSPHKAVINTPYPMISDGNHFYLNAASDVWYRSDKATGPFEFETSIPADIAAMVKPDQVETGEEQVEEAITAANAPEIVVTTQPAELIVTEGPAAFVPLIDDLLVLQNSADDVFMHVGSQKFYIVLAGRWYNASSLNGPWTYQQADELPQAFANIPKNSDQSDSRVYVAGTEEAREAVLDAQVPQTKAVARGEAEINIDYDGKPVYRPVDGTDLVYIENTGSTVILSDGLYYLVENGVWYVSSSPNGPWQVSDHRPEQVETILPTSPVYNARYVRVYDSTPSVVYVGHTPGYYGSYVYHNTVVFGSGWYHRPWISPYYYYPRYSSWGFHASYNPWGGWNFGLSWGWGPFSFSYYSGGYWHHNHYWHHRHYGRWGPGRYRHRPAHRGHRDYGRDRYAHNDRGRRGSGGHSGDGQRDRGRQGPGGRSGDQYRDRGRQNEDLSRGGARRSASGDRRGNERRSSGRDERDTRQANRSGTDGRQQQDYRSPRKGERNRIGPVTPSDLRIKADIRDVNLKSKNTRLLADNSGNVYRSDADDRAYGRTDAQRKNRPANGGESRRSRAGVANQRSRERSGDSAAQPSTGRANAGTRQSRQKDSNNTRRSSPTENTVARQSRPNAGGSNSRQRSSQGRSKTEPAQNSSRTRSMAQNTSANNRARSAPAKSSAGKSTRKNTSKQKSSSKSSKSSKRAGNRSARAR